MAEASIRHADKHALRNASLQLDRGRGNSLSSTGSTGLQNVCFL